jgi:hypothetical protein
LTCSRHNFRSGDATSSPGIPSWRWPGAAALTSAVFPAVFAQATLVANWSAEHPVPVPDDGSPGGGNMGPVLDVPTFALAAVLCLLFPLLWGIAAIRARKGAAMKDLAVAFAVLQGTASLVALPVAATLPWNWADVTALVAADVIALGVALRPHWQRWTLPLAAWHRVRRGRSSRARCSSATPPSTGRGPELALQACAGPHGRPKRVHAVFPGH